MTIMKKTLYASLAIVVALIFAACGASLSKENRDARSSMDGTWQLQDISYGGDGYFKSTPFGDVDSKCFKGSEWFFRSNNSTGYYNISDPDCATGQRNIRWAITDVNGAPSQFQFKFTDEKRNDLNKGVGFIFSIISLTPQSFTISSRVMVDGKPVEVIYNFSKISDLR